MFLYKFFKMMQFVWWTQFSKTLVATFFMLYDFFLFCFKNFIIEPDILFGKIKPNQRNIHKFNTAWKASVFGVILVHIFPHLDWIRRDTQYLRTGSYRTIRLTQSLYFFPGGLYLTHLVFIFLLSPKFVKLSSDYK